MSTWSFVNVDTLDKHPGYQKHNGVSVGDFVEISEPIRRGTVKFIGATEFGGPYKIWYGIELNKPYAKSKTDGTVRGIKYFETSRPSTGVFVLRNKITKVIRCSAYEQTNLDSHCLSTYRISEDFKKRYQKGHTGGQPLTIPEAKYSIELSWVDSEEEDEISESKESKAPIIRTRRSLEYIDQHSQCSLHSLTEDFISKRGRAPSDWSVKSNAPNTGHSMPPCRVSTRFRSKILEEIENDPMMMAISEAAKANLNSRASLLNLIADLQRCTNLINYHLPRVTEQLQKASSDKIYATNVIQDLLKRVQKEQKSTKIRDDFTGRKSLALDSNTEYNSHDIDAMVNVMAWMRNNIRVSALMDENDAKMSSMGAAEVRESLIQILLSVTEEKERAHLKQLTMKHVLSDNLMTPGQSRSNSCTFVHDLVESFDDDEESVDRYKWV